MSTQVIYTLATTFVKVFHKYDSLVAIGMPFSDLLIVSITFTMQLLAILKCHSVLPTNKLIMLLCSNYHIAKYYYPVPNCNYVAMCVVPLAWLR